VRYRPEIDGLRAVAVLPVILFHAGFGAFRGGYVGVDVFFVISGYLITTILLADLDRGTFSLVYFYERRARRVLPALFLVLAATTPFAWLVLSPRALREFCSSLVAVATFTSNFHFLRQSGYFDVAAELKPLLHTWSLAVEEQYYIVFPLLLLITWRLGRRRLAWLFAALFLASLVGGVRLAAQNPTAAFYLFPTRAWEILLGAFAALHFTRPDPPRLPLRWNQWLSAVGLGGIILAVLTFDEAIPYPGLHALLPTVGTLLIIVCATDGTGVQRLLSLRPAVLIGLVSYSAYLWHQPVFALVRYRAATPPSPVVMLALAAGTLPLAYLSWRFVEAPFRRRDVVPRRTVFSLATAASALTIGVGVWGKHVARDATEVVVGSHRIPLPVTFTGLVHGGKPCSVPSFEPLSVCRLPGKLPAGGRTLVLIGDSHARVLTEAIAERTDLFAEFIDLSAGGCPFLLDLPVFIGTDSHRCTAQYQRSRLAFLSGIDREDLVVVVAGRWPLYLDGRGFDNTVGGVEPTRDIVATDDPRKPQEERTAEYFEALGGTLGALSGVAGTVVFVLPSQPNGWDPLERALRLSSGLDSPEALFEALRIPLAPVAAWVSPVGDFVRAEAARYPNVVVIDPLPLTCGRPEGFCEAGAGGQFYFSDQDHLSLAINRMIAGEVARALADRDSSAEARSLPN